MANWRWLGTVVMLTVLPCVSFADPELAAEIAEMAESDLRDSCEDEDFLACLKVKAAACTSAASAAIESCRAKLPKDIDEKVFDKDPEAVTGAWSTCVTEKISAALKISRAAIDKCNTFESDDAGEPGATPPPPSRK